MKINGGNPVIEKLLYGDGAIIFNLVALIRESENPTVYSDGKSFLTAQSATRAPVWIYTNESADEGTRAELFGILSQALNGNAQLRINAREGFTQDVLSRFARENGFALLKGGVLNAYSISNVNRVPRAGELICAGKEHINIIARLIRVAAADDNDGELSEEEAIAFAEKHAGSGNLFLWRDGEVKSMARIVRYGVFGRITSVVTERSARGRGYAKMLTGELSGMLLNEGRIPVLYARAENICANACYRHVGFVKKGEICEYTIKNKEH